MKGYRRHKFLFGFFRVTLGWVFKLMFNLRLERFGGDGEPYLLLGNHTANFDPIWVGMAARDHLYFVASEHLSRKGLASRLLAWVFAPISRLKGSTDAQAAMTVIRTVRKGVNVCLFPEGSRTFDGANCPIFPATGKLVKSSGVKLITYRFKGGYLSNPRWSPRLRRGRVTGEVAGVYTPEQLRTMSPEEINALLVRDLHVDADEEQRKNPTAYKGRRPAEYLQAALFVCPRCGGLDTLCTKGSRFWCACGLAGSYTPYGSLEGEDLPYKTVRDWSRWQETQLARIAGNLEKNPISDDGFCLYEVTEKGRDRILAKGRLTLTADRLRCADRDIPLDEVSDIAIIGRDKLVLSDRQRHYELRPDRICCANKYVALFKELKKKG